MEEKIRLALDNPVNFEYAIDLRYNKVENPLPAKYLDSLQQLKQTGRAFDYTGGFGSWKRKPSLARYEKRMMLNRICSKVSSNRYLIMDGKKGIIKNMNYAFSYSICFMLFRPRRLPSSTGGNEESSEPKPESDSKE
jgi:hypothetical protein